MSAEHKRPLYAFVLVAALSVIVVGHGLRSDALVDILRGEPLKHRIIAAGPAPGELPDSARGKRGNQTSATPAPQPSQTKTLVVEPSRPGTKLQAVTKKSDKKADGKTRQSPSKKNPSHDKRRNNAKERPDRTERPRTQRSPRHSPHTRHHSPRSERRAPRSSPAPVRRHDHRRHHHGPSQVHRPRDHRATPQRSDSRHSTRHTPRHNPRESRSERRSVTKHHRSHKSHGHQTQRHRSDGHRSHGHRSHGHRSHGTSRGRR